MSAISPLKKGDRHLAATRWCEPLSIRLEPVPVFQRAAILSQLSGRRGRRGFTLVELLVVILIIGLLVALVSTAVFKALNTAKQARIKVEIDGIATELVKYSNENKGEYPPCFASYAAMGTAHQNRIVRHIQTRFPRYTPASTSGSTFYDNFRNDVMSATVTASYGFPANGVASLDVNNLDQAEALVFWLGGFPTGTTQARETRVCGFSKDPLYPFIGPGVQQQRTPLLYAFDPIRLVDRDNDGWLEYIPPGVSASGDMPPYVYFDSFTYTSSQYNVVGTTLNMTSYPSTTTGALRGPAANATQWGACWPLWRAAAVGTTTNPQWVNSETFQLISAGLDGIYSTDGTVSSTGPSHFPNLSPVGTVPDPTIYDAMYDNLTNFAEGDLKQERERQTQ